MWRLTKGRVSFVQVGCFCDVVSTLVRFPALAIQSVKPMIIQHDQIPPNCRSSMTIFPVLHGVSSRSVDSQSANVHADNVKMLAKRNWSRMTQL